MTRKTQKKLRKLLTLVCCAVMLVCVSVGATIAYLTSQDTVTNTFTVGNVQIKLDETNVDNDAAADGTIPARDKQNDYHLLPGQTHTKDPMVTVLANNEECYVRALVTVEYAADADEHFNPVSNWIDINTTAWTWNNPTTTKTDDKITRVYEVRYNTKVAASTTDTELTKLFTTITVPDDIANEDLATLNGLKIDVVAHAIQADGFNTADLAWAEWE